MIGACIGIFIGYGMVTAVVLSALILIKLIIRLKH